MTTRNRRVGKGEAIRHGDALLLEAMQEAGWRQSDANACDRVTAYLTENGYDIAPEEIIDWDKLSSH